jgi:hypothetical protein
MAPDGQSGIEKFSQTQTPASFAGGQTQLPGMSGGHALPSASPAPSAPMPVSLLPSALLAASALPAPSASMPASLLPSASLPPSAAMSAALPLPVSPVRQLTPASDRTAIKAANQTTSPKVSALFRDLSVNKAIRRGLKIPVSAGSVLPSSSGRPEWRPPRYHPLAAPLRHGRAGVPELRAKEFCHFRQRIGCDRY